MEPRRFDALTQALTQATDQTPTRRSLLAILAGGLLATGALGASETAVKGKKRKKKEEGWWRGVQRGLHQRGLWPGADRLPPLAGG